MILPRLGPRDRLRVFSATELKDDRDFGLAWLVQYIDNDIPLMALDNIGNNYTSLFPGLRPSFFN